MSSSSLRQIVSDSVFIFLEVGFGEGFELHDTESSSTCFRFFEVDLEFWTSNNGVFWSFTAENDIIGGLERCGTVWGALAKPEVEGWFWYVFDWFFFGCPDEEFVFFSTNGFDEPGLDDDLGGGEIKINESSFKSSFWFSDGGTVEDFFPFLAKKSFAITCPCSPRKLEIQ